MISILIVNWNKSDLTLACIASIRNHTRDVSYEIVIVDNGSQPDQVKILSRHCDETGCRVIALKQNLYFGEANNIAAEAAKGDILLLLNNDVFVTEGYIQALLGTLEGEYRAGAVGPKFIYPDGRLQEAGAYVKPDGWTMQYGKANVPAPYLSAHGSHIVDYCSAACLLIRRAVFLGAGGFDPLFDPAYFEDVDLMLRLRSMGLFTYLCADVTVVHDENTTSSEVWDESGLRSVIATNHERFCDRWGHYVGHRLFTDTEIPRFEAVSWMPEPAVPAGLPILVLQAPGLIRESPEWRQAIALAGGFADEAHVCFAAEEACSRCRIYTIAGRLGVKLGSFSIQREPGRESKPGETVISLRRTDRNAIEPVSATGPLAARVTTRMGDATARPASGCHPSPF